MGVQAVYEQCEEKETYVDGRGYSAMYTFYYVVETYTALDE